jgi:hypothetical protein
VHRNAHSQRDDSSTPFGFHEPYGFLHCGFLSGNDDLTGCIEIRGRHDPKRRSFSASIFNNLPVDSENRADKTSPLFHCLLHVPAARSNEIDGICEGQRSGRNQSSIFTKTVPGDRRWPQTGTLKHPQGYDADREQSRLRMRGEV